MVFGSREGQWSPEGEIVFREVTRLEWPDPTALWRSAADLTKIFAKQYQANETACSSKQKCSNGAASSAIRS